MIDKNDIGQEHNAVDGVYCDKEEVIITDDNPVESTHPVSSKVNDDDDDDTHNSNNTTQSTQPSPPPSPSNDDEEEEKDVSNAELV